jgi:hypothetical protein
LIRRGGGLSKYIFNEIFKEIVDTYYIDSNVLGGMIDRDSSRIRHYKSDSKPGKAILDKLITSLCEIIDEKNDYHTNTILMERLNHYVNQQEIITDEIRAKLSEIKSIDTYISLLLRKSRELSSDSNNIDHLFVVKQDITAHDQTFIAKVNQAHQYFENSLYDEAISIYENLIEDPQILKFPQLSQTTHTDLGLIYRNCALSQYNQEVLNKSIHHLTVASTISFEQNDLTNYALINKYLGTIYTVLFNIEDSENNFKKAIHFYDIASGVFYNNLEEQAKVFINYGILFLHYSNLRNSRNFLKNAISYFIKAINYFEENDNDYFHALACLNCSGAYSFLAEISNTKTNAVLAIQMVQNALKIFTIEDYPIQYAQSISNLGHTHYIMANYSDTTNNCSKAIKYINHALSIVTEDKDTNSYLIAHLNLSAIYVLLSHYTNRQDNIKNAAESLEKCKKYYTHHSNSLDHLKTNLNYAEVLIEIGEFNVDRNLLNEAETVLKSTLDLCFRLNCSYLSASANFSLSRIYFNYYKMNKLPEYLDSALTLAKDTLTIFSINDYPLHHALTMHHITKIYHYIQDYDSCKTAYESMLRIYTREKYPDKYMVIIEEYNEVLNMIGE